MIVSAPANLEIARILLIGVGTPRAGERMARQNRGGIILAQLNTAGEQTAAVFLDAARGREAALGAADLAYGARLRSYRFDKYRTKEKPDQKPSLKELTFLVDNPKAAKREFQSLEKIAEAVLFTRDLVSEPANVIYPETLGRGGALAWRAWASRSRSSTRNR